MRSQVRGGDNDKLRFFFFFLPGLTDIETRRKEERRLEKGRSKVRERRFK